MIGYALLSWRTFVYRDQTIAHLRPFVHGHSLMQQMINPAPDTLSQAQALFASMCEQFLGATRAQITPDKALSLLVGTPLVYPGGADPAPLPAAGGDKIQQLDPRHYAGFHWLIPLWSERGRIGVLLLGEKAGRGLYTEEEMQVAQAAGERILDLFAGEIMAQQLVQLQRRRMTAQRVMDFQTRRTLHDKSLPALHEAILALSTCTDPAAPAVIRTLSLLHKEISDLIHTTPDLTAKEPAPDFLGLLRNDIQQEFGGEFAQIHWQVSPGVHAVDGLTADILYGAVREAVRNAAIHGRGDNPRRPLSLWITVQPLPAFTITIRDNGIGPQAEHHPRGGSGGGLALHGTLMALLGGSLSIEAAPEGGTVVSLAV
jgi:two-component sensor histidine kinase